jgi:aspartate/methionine/tyrosine aminotransferase
MAKTFGLAGLRLGWLSSKNADLLHKVEVFKDYLTICSSPTSEVLAMIALNNSADLIKINTGKIKRKTSLFRQFQHRNDDLVEFFPPRSGSTAFVRPKSTMTAYEYAEDLVQKTGIVMLTSEMFNYGHSHLRVGFGCENLPQILEVWEKFHRQH